MPWKIKHKTKTLKKHGRHTKEPRYWSAEFGWVAKESADTFTDEQKEAQSVLMPNEEWVEV